MANQLPITIQMGALPPRIRWIPQQLADAIAERLSLVTAQSFALFVSGSTAPSTNVGPWLKDGREWFIWDVISGSYIPQILGQASLGYTIGPNPPDPNVYQFWIKTAPGGSPQAVMTYFSGAWTDVYAAVIGDYMTTAAFNAAIANYTDTAGMNAAIASAVSGATFPSYPALAVLETVPQSIPVDGAAHKIVFETTPINPAPAPFNIVASRYIAPANGIYSVSAASQFDNDTGVAASMQVLLGVRKNGVAYGVGAGDATPNPVGSRWFPGFGGLLVSLAINDYVELWAELNDGTNTGAVDLTTIDFNVIRVSG